MMNKVQYMKMTGAAVCAAVVVSALITLTMGSGAVPTAYAQDRYLESRINQIEQRFISIDSRINRIEQEVRRPSPTLPQVLGNTDNEVRTLQLEVNALRTRLGEAECALLRLDQRTLTPAARRSTAANSACREGFTAPVQLSARPGS